MLSLEGYQVKAVYDGASAFEVAPAFEPDVVLLDLGLPQTDGYEICRRLRQERWGAKVLVIAVHRVGPERRPAADPRGGLQCPSGEAAGAGGA